jgi:hypothetical protein
MVSLSTSSFNLSAHDHHRRDLLPGGKSEQETTQHESDAAARGKMYGRLHQSQPNPLGSFTDRSGTTPSALTSYFQLLFQETHPNAAAVDLKISVDNAKARPDYRSKVRRRKKKKRIERSPSLTSNDGPCPPISPVSPPVASKQTSRWETGSPALTCGMRKTSPGSVAEECANSNAAMSTSTMPRRPIRSLMSESNDHRIPPPGLFVVLERTKNKVCL